MNSKRIILPRTGIAAALAVASIALVAGTATAQLAWTERTVIAPAARADAAFVSTPGGLLFGGTNLATGLGDTWRWAGTNWVELHPTHSPSARWEHAMVAIGPMAILFGGQDGVAPLADTWFWDGSDWIRRFPATSPPPRRGHGMAYDTARDRVVLFGGIGALGPLADTWEYDGVTWTQVPTTVQPVPMSFPGMAYDHARHLVVLFGGLNAAQAPLNQTWVWNGTTWIQRTPATNPAARSRSPLVSDHIRSRIVMFGGQGASAGLADTWEWDGTNWSNRNPAAPVPAAGGGHVVCYDPLSAERTVLFGGRTATGLRTTETWLWSGANWTAYSTGFPAPRVTHAMAFDSTRDRTVLFGGNRPGIGLLNDTWEWDGLRWWQRATTGPAVRRGHALVYERARNRTILFGGNNGNTYYQDTWGWNGTAWAQISPALRPPTMAYQAMAYDAARDRTVLFGGNNATVQHTATWEFDGTNWAQRTPVHSPPYAAHQAMAYDEVRSRCVLVQAQTGGVTTWEWDGIDWTQRTATVSPPELQPSLVYDSARQRTVLFGWESLTPGRNEVWEWDGSEWRLKVPAGSPPLRTQSATAYDSTRRLVVLTGGADYAGTTLADTWEYASGAFASYESFGTGCLGSRGVPELSVVPGTLPAIGCTLRVDVTVLPLVPTPTFLLLGLSRNAIGGLPLPLDLAVYGMPGCTLYQSNEALQLIANVGGAARYNWAIPDLAWVLGLRFYHQAFVVDRNANSPGLIVSNAAEGVIGS